MADSGPLSQPWVPGGFRRHPPCSFGHAHPRPEVVGRGGAGRGSPTEAKASLVAGGRFASHSKHRLGDEEPGQWWVGRSRMG